MTAPSSKLKNLAVMITPGALKILEECREDPHTTKAVSRAIFNVDRSLSSSRTLMIEKSRLGVYFDPDRQLALIITAQQGWRGIRPDMVEELIAISTPYFVA